MLLMMMTMTDMTNKRKRKKDISEIEHSHDDLMMMFIKKREMTKILYEL